MRVLETHDPFGAELGGLEPGHVTAEQGADLRQLLTRYKVLIFRDVDLSPDQHVQLIAQMGRAMTEAADQATLNDPGHVFGKVNFVTTRPDEYISGRDPLGYHADYSFYSDGACEAISLHAVQVDLDNPTTYTDLGAAARDMPPPLLARLREIELVKCANFFHNRRDNAPRYRMSDRVAGKDYGNTVSVHPAVRRHPRSGADLVNVCQIFTSHVKGWDYSDSDELFAEVERWQYRPEYAFRHHWRTGDLVIWDNIALQHARDPITQASTRHLQRVAMNPWDVGELQQRSGRLLDPRDPRLRPAS